MLNRYRGKSNPWPVSWNVQDEINRMFEDIGNPFGWVEQGRVAPAMDVRETEDAYVIEADVPGLKKDDVHIEVADNVLTIKGERTEEQRENRKDYHRVERQFGSFVRSVSIPGGFDAGRVSARFENGVLTVTLPKPEERKPRRIEVKAG
jgi:HSP20 family protein